MLPRRRLLWLCKWKKKDLSLVNLGNISAHIAVIVRLAHPEHNFPMKTENPSAQTHMA